MTAIVKSPLSALVARAATALPAATGATATAQRRRDRAHICAVLCDVSSSMDEAAGAKRKIDVLRAALAMLPQDVRIVAFSSYAAEIAAGAALPEPNDSTALHLALDCAAGIEPGRVIVISDGRPDDERAALTAAARLDARIDVIYCGPDNDRQGLAFMRRLARGGGQVHRRSMAREPQRLAATLRTLALPAPASK